MPLTPQGKKVLAKFQKQYGDDLGKERFYMSMNKGTAGSSKWHRSPDAYNDSALGENPPRVEFRVRPENEGVETAKQAGGIPSGVQQNDGTANARADQQTKSSDRKGATGGTTRYPAIDRFSGENV